MALAAWNGAAAFQSLSGFFRPCNRILRQEDQLSGRFNPYRVFSGLATAGDGRHLGEVQSFNPYRVFSGLATRFR